MLMMITVTVMALHVVVGTARQCHQGNDQRRKPSHPQLLDKYEASMGAEEMNALPRFIISHFDLDGAVSFRGVERPPKGERNPWIKDPSPESRKSTFRRPAKRREGEVHDSRAPPPIDD